MVNVILSYDQALAGTIYVILGGLLGLVFMLVGSMIIPKLVNRLTPKIDEEKEIARGNMAVANYFSAIVSSAIIGMSIIIAAAIIAGLL